MRTSAQLDKSLWFLFGVLAFYLLVAYNSSGYNNADEHYQIVEFANYKLGKATLNDLAWEFNARVRPGLQPALCFLIFKLSFWLGITDAYKLAFILRAIGAIFSVFVVRFFALSNKSIIDRKIFVGYILLSYFLWFLPYINVRFSSENWSGLFFVLSLSIIQRGDYQNNLKKLILIGALLGVAMLFRYQSALLAMGIIMWLLFVQKLSLKKTTVIIAAIIGVLAIGFFIDRWLYGVYSITLYNYFYVNIVQGVASNYGVSPWYYIILYIIRWPGPLGIFIFAAIVILLIYKPKSLLLWSTLPFLVVHSIIPHKELRFLYPIANLVPLLLVLAYQEVANQKFPRYKVVQYAGIAAFVLVDAAGLIAISSKGAGLAKVSVTQYIHKNYPHKNVNVIVVDGLNPYSDWAFPKNTFYNSSEVVLTPIVTIWQKDMPSKKKRGYTNLLLISNNDITGPKTISMLKNTGAVKVFQSIPWLVQQVNLCYDESINDSNLMVYEYKD
jgi:phosphatidylinositol glycan class B